ncbi:ATP-binding protein [Motilimonas sp. E26]|uniref:ATP-binding protein n=1 Tax=Motilimonas TaxID=1914248 RepID=UPI001E5CC80E|nr:ATP-binding protein [Motilimonas sp. E26]MCE0558253.1 CHASE domain-containing protein [Motilimonas sp. E26]
MKYQIIACLILCLGATLSIGSWHHLKQHETRVIQNEVANQSANITKVIRVQLTEQVQSLKRMAKRWEYSNGTPFDQWHFDALNFMTYEQAYHSLAWVDKYNSIQWVAPIKQKSENQHLLNEISQYHNNALKQARTTRTVAISQSVKLTHGGKGFLVFLPLYPKGEFDGYIVGVFSFNKLLSLILENGHFDTPVTIMEAGQIVYQQVPENTRIDQNMLQTKMTVYGRHWEIYNWPSQSLLNKSTSMLPSMVLTFGLCISLLLSFSFYFARQVERKKVELEAKNDELRQKNKEIANTQSQLVHSTKLASLGEMATGIAHELNQPLQVISMNTEMGPEYLAQSKHNRVVKAFTDIMQQVDRAQSIIKQLRCFGRDSAHDEHQTISSNELINSSLMFLKRQFVSKNIEVRENIAPALPHIKCNKIQIEQVLLNLLVNARDAVEDCDEKIVGIKAFQKDRRLFIEVYDSGIGIPLEAMDKIFDPFFTTKEVGKGTGLGLSISHAIIEQHGGEIKVESELGKGTKFMLQLPLP